MAAQLALKIVWLGDNAVGKTSMLMRFTEGSFQATYPEFEQKIKHVSLSGQDVKLLLWDTMGMERFRNITSGYLLGHDLVFLVFDVSNEASFTNMEGWLMEVKRRPTSIKVLIGNKIDCPDGPRKVDSARAKAWADEHQLGYFEISCKTGENVEAAIMQSAEIALKKKLELEARGTETTTNPCCTLL